MSKAITLKNIYTKAACIVNEINANASQKWHPEKETVVTLNIMPSSSRKLCV